MASHAVDEHARRRGGAREGHHTSPTSGASASSSRSEEATSVVLCTSGYDHTIRYWDASTGQCYRTLQYPGSQVNALCVTPDKRYLAAVGNPHVRLFDINSNSVNPVTTYESHKGNITAVGFSKDGKWMYTSSEDMHIKIWDLRAPNVQTDFVCSSPINSVALHPNQSEIISVDQSGTVRTWDLVSNREQHPSFQPAGEIPLQSVSVAGDASTAVAANNEGNCFFWKPGSLHEGKSAISTLNAHPGAYILKCVISPNAKILATTSSDHTIKLWNVQDHSLTKTLTGHQRWVWDCAFSADSQYLVSASSDHTARLWELSRGEDIRRYKGHSKAVVSIALNDMSI